MLTCAEADAPRRDDHVIVAPAESTAPEGDDLRDLNLALGRIAEAGPGTCRIYWRAVQDSDLRATDQKEDGAARED